VISDDVAFAFCTVDGEAHATTLDGFYPVGPQAAHVEFRVSYILRHRGDGWKVIHCEDSSLDLYRAHQLWEHHQSLAELAMAVLDPILHPPVPEGDQRLGRPSP
jgi:hypothetical protein